MLLKLNLLAFTLLLLVFTLCHAHESESGSCPFGSHGSHDPPRSGRHCHHHHHPQQQKDLQHHHCLEKSKVKLPEEMAEEEDLEMYGFSHLSDGEFGTQELSKLSLWGNAMGCSLLVSMASLICLIILPVIFLQGKPSKSMVDALAAFGAGAMLGDAFLHQLPHAFGGSHSHVHVHHVDNIHDHHPGHGHSHSHSLEDLSVGLSVLSGIVLFLLVEKVVRFVEDHSVGHARGPSHHHHHHKSNKKLKTEESDDKNSKPNQDEAFENLDAKSNTQSDGLRKRSVPGAADDNKTNLDAVDSSGNEKGASAESEAARSPSSLVFGYLNLFSDGVHNFTDGMALGSAFLLHGSIGGWSRTLFLLAHELPQEVGDFGILVRSGFSVSKALFFNFLSALVALAGTALALLLGKDPGNSSLIEGFTAGGFIYISVAGVLPEMNTEYTRFKSTLIQLTALILGMAVALCISLVE